MTKSYGRVTVILGLLLFLIAAKPAHAQDVRTGVEQLARQIVKGAPAGRQLRVAIADFPDLQGITSNLGRYVATGLTTHLAQNPTKFSVIERQRLGQVLAELKFSMSDLVDPSKAKQLGRMAGVEAIVVGTVSDLGNQVDLDARMIEIETNRMLLGSRTTISKDQVVKDLLEGGRQEAATLPGVVPLGVNPVKVVTVNKFVGAMIGSFDGGVTRPHDGIIDVHVEKLELTSEQLVVQLLFENHEDRLYRMTLNEPRKNTLVVDDMGKEYALSDVRVASLDIPPMAKRVRLRLGFPAPAPSAKRVNFESILEVFNEQGRAMNNFNVKVRIELKNVELRSFQ